MPWLEPMDSNLGRKIFNSLKSLLRCKRTRQKNGPFAPLFYGFNPLQITTCFLPFLLKVPNYYKVISKPMDLSNVRAKLQTQNFAHYQSFSEFVADCRLIFDNCAIFNEVSVYWVLRSNLWQSHSLIFKGSKNYLLSGRVNWINMYHQSCREMT